MLVLTRKNGEIINIGQGIEVKVLSINRHVVKLGFSAPPQVVIRRQEIGRTEDRCPLKETKPVASDVSCLPFST